jgi:hypothetical protein
VRRRSGTIASQAIVPIPAATRAPRDWVSRIARIAPRAEPEQAGDRERRRRADRVPVLEGLADPVGDLRLADRPRPDARGQRVDDRRSRGEHDPLDHSGCGSRGQPRPGDRRGEDGQVRERAASLDVREVRHHRPHHRHRGDHGQRGEQRNAERAVDRAGTAPRDSGRDDRPAGQDDEDLDDRRAAQLAAARGTEGDAREGAAEDYVSGAKSVGTEHAASGSWI